MKLLLFLLPLAAAAVATATDVSSTRSRPPSLIPFSSDEDSVPASQNYNGGGQKAIYADSQRESFQPQTAKSPQASSLKPEDPAIDSSNLRYSGYSGGTNYGWAGTNTGYNGGRIICTVCTDYDAVNAQRCCAYGYRQCCNVGVYSSYNSWNSRPIGGIYNPYSSYNQEKPGSCYYNTAYNSGNSFFNQNAGYYATRRSDDADHGREKREAPIGEYQAYGVPGYSSGGGWNSGGGYSGGGYSAGGYSGGGRYPGSWGYSSGYGASHGCKRDYDCPGIQKCCVGICANPTSVIG